MPHVARRLIFVTGDVAGTEAERFLEESGCRWVPKPFRLRDLVKACARSAGLNTRETLRTLRRRDRDRRILSASRTPLRLCVLCVSACPRVRVSS
jgi:hypothetical protein